MKVKDLVNESDFADLGLKGLGSELDRDEEGDDFKQKRMFDQLGKVIDSAGNPNPIKTVKTDDGDEVEVTPGIAKALRYLEQNTSAQGGQKEKVMRMLQTTDGLNKAIDMVKSKLM